MIQMSEIDSRADEYIVPFSSTKLRTSALLGFVGAFVILLGCVIVTFINFSLYRIGRGFEVRHFAHFSFYLFDKIINSILLAAEAIAIFLFSLRFLTISKNPLVKLTREGLSIHSMMYKSICSSGAKSRQSKY